MSDTYTVNRTTVPRACSTVPPPLQRSKTGPQYPERVLQFCILSRDIRQDHSPMFYCSASSSEKQDWTTVHSACSTVLPPLQRSKTGPQSHVLLLCLLFREAKQDHSTHNSSAPSPENQLSSSGPIEQLTLQEQSWNNGEDLLKTTAVIQTADHLRQSHAERQRKILAAWTFFVSWDATHSRYRSKMTAETTWFITKCLVVTSCVFSMLVYKTVVTSVSVLLVIQLVGYLLSCLFTCLLVCPVFCSFLSTEI